MGSLLEVLQVNENIIYFLYGQVFFVLGLAIALQSRESRRRSRLPLAGCLGWMAAFGITHGLHEWGNVFIPIQATYLSRGSIDALRTFQWGLLVLSFLFLLQFGLLVTLAPSRLRGTLQLACLLAVLAGLAAFLTSGRIVAGGSQGEFEEWPRLLLVVPGAGLAGYGIFRQARLAAALGPRRFASYFRLAALSLIAYAVFASVPVPSADALASRHTTIQLLDILVLMLRSLAGMGMALGIGWGVKLFDAETNQLLQEAEQNQLQEEVRSQLFHRAIAAQEDERRRIARELHDETGQHLTAVIMGLGAAREVLDRDPARAGAILDDTRELAVGALQCVREMILGLRPASLDDLGLLPALRRLGEDLGRRAGFEVEIDGSRLTKRLPAEVETVLFRIVQEGLNNVSRHAGARRVGLQLSLGDDGVYVLLEDDGVGFDPTRVEPPGDGRRLGLLGMQERASLAGGEVVVESAIGAGTRLHVRLPIDRWAEQPEGGRIVAESNLPTAALEERA